MRPDKKGKPNHHNSSSKKNSKEGSGSDAKGEKSRTTRDLAAPPPSRKERSEEDAKEDATDETEEKYARRGVTSNWTKYEIPSDDEEGDGEEASMTGEDFNYVLQNASGADSLFRLKAEKEWEESSTMMTNEFFTLDLAALERDISTIPLNEQLNLTDQDVDDLARSVLREEAEKRKTLLNAKMVRSDVILKRNADEANATILSKLCEKNLGVLPQGTITKVIEVDKLVPPSTEHPPVAPASNAEVDNLEEWLDDFLDK